MKLTAKGTAAGGLCFLLGVGVTCGWQAVRSPHRAETMAINSTRTPSDRPAAGAEARVGARPRAVDSDRAASGSNAVHPAGMVLQRLGDLRVTAKEPLGMRQVLVELEKLRQLGAAALPAIRAFLADGRDADYDGAGAKTFKGGKVPGDFVFPPSLRLGLLEVVKNIGGPEAEALLAAELKSSGRGVEVAYLAGVLQDGGGTRFRETALGAARELLAMPLTNRASNPLDRSDREYLYGVLTAAGDASYLPEARRQLLLPDGRVDRGALSYLQTMLREGVVAVADQAWQDPRIASAEKEPLARAVLAYVGANAHAEDVYRRALSDPAMSDSQRQNLIEDLNQAGFSEVKKSPAAILALIERRLAVIERLAPQFGDRTAVAAFVEARKDLLNMRARVAAMPVPKP
jgi:hypothetical protein